MKIFTRETIESFTNPYNEEVVENLLAFLEENITQIVEEISKKTPIVTKDIEFEIVGEFENASANVNSQLDLFIVFKSPQLELNTMKLVNNKFVTFWNKVKNAYTKVKEERRLRRKRKQRKLKNISVPENKYSMLTLKQEFLTKFLQRLDNKCFITTTKYGLKLYMRDYFAVDVCLYPVLKGENNTFKLYNSFSNTFFNLDFEKRQENIDEKLQDVDQEIFYDLLKVFNCLYYNIQNRHPNQILIESLLYSCPNSLFFGEDFYHIFLKVLNYIYNSKISVLKSVTNNESLHTSKLIDDSPATIMAFVKNVANMID